MEIPVYLALEWLPPGSGWLTTNVTVGTEDSAEIFALVGGLKLSLLSSPLPSLVFIH